MSTNAVSSKSTVTTRTSEAIDAPAVGRLKADREQLAILSKGFEILALAATFISAIQGQVMSTTLNIPLKQETIAIRAINSFYLGGLILDIMSAVLAFLTSRWLQRLSDDEKDLLEAEFTRRACNREKATIVVTKKKTPGLAGHLVDVEKGTQKGLPFIDRLAYAWLSLSLFVPMPLLVIGVVCMILGIYTYTWTQQPTVVAAFVTLAGVGTLPFLAGVFLIGRRKERRRTIILRLSTMQGDW